MKPGVRPEWMQRQERSSANLLKLMVWMSLTFGRRVARLVLHGVAVYFVLFAPTARRASSAYLELALGRRPGWRDSYRHIFAFASTVHDRMYLLNDRFDVFDIEERGREAVLEAMQKQPGVLLFGAHLGSFEALRSVGRSQAGLRVAMLMYEENARKVNAALAAINPNAMADVIALGRLGSMLKVRDKLDEGYLVGMLADRTLGNDAMAKADFLGRSAAFPIGPWRLAATLRRPVFLMVGLYLGGNRYRLQFEPLADFSQVERPGREAAIDAAIARYAANLTRLCGEAPYNWFNFFDFWQAR